MLENALKSMKGALHLKWILLAEIEGEKLPQNSDIIIILSELYHKGH